MSERQYLGTVVDIGTTGQATVLIDGIARQSRVAHNAKSVRAGDTVTVVKRGGTYWVESVNTYHAPPVVAPVTPTSVPNAATTSGAVSIASRYSYNVNYLPSSPTSAQIKAWSDVVVGVLMNAINNNFTRAFAGLDDLAAKINAMQSAQNTNASRLNSTRDNAVSAAQAVAPIRDALADERIVR